MSTSTTKHRLLDPEAALDSQCEYLIEAHTVISPYVDFIASKHPDGKAFPARVLDAMQQVQTTSATARLERAQAVDATAEQTESLQRARGVASRVRDLGAFVAGEFCDDTQSSLRKRVRTATGIGLRANLDRRAGVVRLLTAQRTGLEMLARELPEWTQFATLHVVVDNSLTELDRTAAQQSREGLEADLAQDALESAVSDAVTGVNRLLRLLNICDDEPAELAQGLRRLEGRHPGAFYRRRQPGVATEPTEPSND